MRRGNPIALAVIACLIACVGVHSAVAAQDGSGANDTAVVAGSGQASDPAGEGANQQQPARAVLPRTDEQPALEPILEGTAGPIVVLTLRGEVSPGMAGLVARAVDSLAEPATGPDSSGNASALIVRVDTLGGRVDAALRIRDALGESPVPVIAYVNNRAISAGALITYAADHIVFAPGASMGAATPIQVSGDDIAVTEKMVSYMRAEMRATAEAHGRRVDVAEAMVDRAVVIDGVVDADTLLTVTTAEALALDVADAVAPNLDALLEDAGASGRALLAVEANWAEKLASWLTNPAVAGLLMSLGLLGLWVELKAPGLGLPGAVGVVCLGAFFFGHMVVELAGWEEIILATCGVALLAVEIFVVPGFGLAGALGILCFAASFVLAMVGLPIGVSWETGALGVAAFRTFVALMVALVGLLALARFLPKTALPNWLVLRSTIGEHSGAESVPSQRRPRALLVGLEGVATTDLRPSGRVEIEGELLDVVARTDWVERGTRVRVVEVGGVRIVVDNVAGTTSPQGGPTESSSIES